MTIRLKDRSSKCVGDFTERGKMRYLTSWIAVILTAFYVGILPNPGHAAAEKVALVIGNARYTELNVLSNPTADALEISKSLTEIGFQVYLKLDTDAKLLRKAIRDFAETSAGSEIGLIYYAGHAVQVNGENYILPTDFELPRVESDVKLGAIRLDDIISSLQSKTRVVMLDSCRENPALAKRLTGTTRGLVTSNGLAPIKNSNSSNGDELFIAFATAAGSVAEDGDGEHSPFTQALLQNLKKEISIDDMFSLVTKDVVKQTSGNQRPYKYASLENIICLACSLYGNKLGSLNVISDQTTVSKEIDDKDVLLTVASDGKSIYLATDSSISNEHGLTKLQLKLIDYSSGVATTSVLKDVFDCKNNKAATYEGYKLKNNIKVTNSEFSTYFENVDLQSVPQNSMLAIIYNFACYRKEYSKNISPSIIKSPNWVSIFLNDQGWRMYAKEAITTSKSQTGIKDVLVKLENFEQKVKIENLKINSGDNLSSTAGKWLPIIINRNRVDCDKHEIQILSEDGFDENGHWRYSAIEKNPIPQTAILGTGNATLLKYLCKKRG